MSRFELRSQGPSVEGVSETIDLVSATNETTARRANSADPGALLVHLDERHVEVRLNGVLHRFIFAREGSQVRLAGNGHTWDFASGESALEAEAGPQGGFQDQIKAPMPGKVVAVLVAEGDVVEADDEILRLEAMKMETAVRAGAPARVAQVLTKAGASVDSGDLLIRLEALEAPEN